MQAGTHGLQRGSSSSDAFSRSLHRRRTLIRWPLPGMQRPRRLLFYVAERHVQCLTAKISSYAALTGCITLEAAVF
jgi:hypothetical protein